MSGHAGATDDDTETHLLGLGGESGDHVRRAMGRHDFFDGLDPHLLEHLEGGSHLGFIAGGPHEHCDLHEIPPAMSERDNIPGQEIMSAAR